MIPSSRAAHEEVSCGPEEILGAVLRIGRVDGYEKYLQIMNDSHFARAMSVFTKILAINGRVVYTFGLCGTVSILD